jgi:hypothetical protein
VTSRFGRAPPVLLVLGALGYPGGVRAEEPRVPPHLEFSFVCPNLSQPTAAEVEARSRVEAQLAGRGPMHVHFYCGPSGLEVELESLGPETASHGVRGEPAGRPLEVALVDLFVQALRTFPSDLSSAESRGSSGGSETSASNAASEPGSPSAPSDGTEPGSKMAQRASGPTAAAASRAEAQPQAEPEATSRPFARLTSDAFLSYESLGSEAFGTLGVGASALFGLHSRFRLGPMARVGWGLDMPNLSLTAMNVGLAVEFSPWRWFSLGVEPYASVHFWRATDPLPAHGVHALWGVGASGDVLFGSPHLALRGGVMLNVLSSDRVVRVQDEELMHIPPVSVELHLGGRFGLFVE